MGNLGIRNWLRLGIRIWELGIGNFRIGSLELGIWELGTGFWEFGGVGNWE